MVMDGGSAFSSACALASSLALIVWSGVVAVHVLALLWGQVIVRRQKSRTSEGGSGGSSQDKAPTITIIKPVKHLQANLEHNLRSWLQIDYPHDKLEVVFCLERRDDPAYELVSRLAAEPTNTVRARIDVGYRQIGINPKLNNIVDAVEACASDYVWISDSGLLAHPSAAWEMVQAAGSNIGIVHRAPVGRLQGSFFSIVEAVYFATQHSHVYLFADMMRLNCVNGMSMMFRRDQIEALGGLATYGKYLAEDHFISQAMYDAGLRHRIAGMAVQNNPPNTLAAFLERQIRFGGVISTTLFRLTRPPCLFQRMLRCMIGGIPAVAELSSANLFIALCQMV